VKEFEGVFLQAMKQRHGDILAELKSGKLPKEGLDAIAALAKELSSQYK